MRGPGGCPKLEERVSVIEWAASTHRVLGLTVQHKVLAEDAPCRGSRKPTPARPSCKNTGLSGLGESRLLADHPEEALSSGMRHCSLGPAGRVGSGLILGRSEWGAVGLEPQTPDPGWPVETARFLSARNSLPISTAALSRRLEPREGG